MKAGLRALLSGVIDYAGLFPPAKLPLDQAIRNYARYRTEPESWMLNRFICPAPRLAELEPFVMESFQLGSPLAISVLGRGGGSFDEFMAGFRADLENIIQFRNRHGNRVQADAVEVRLPGADLYLRSCAAVIRLHTEVATVLRSQSRPVFHMSYEPVTGSGWRLQVESLISSLATTFPEGNNRFGLKLRCGGLEPSTFPVPEQIAFAVITCRDAHVPLKLTAGLHHPVRHFDRGVQTHMHGFLNVFVAGVLAYARRLSEEQVRSIIEDEDASSFVFDDEGLSWKGNRATVAEIETARREAVTSFGSCSFDEPRDDLRALGLL